MRARLTPGGLYVQWAPTARVVDTFTAVFPHALLLLAVSRSWSAATAPIPFDPPALLRAPGLARGARALRAAATRPSRLAWRRSCATPPQVWSAGRRRAGPDALTDMFPRDEFFVNQPWMDARTLRRFHREAAR